MPLSMSGRQWRESFFFPFMREGLFASAVQRRTVSHRSSRAIEGLASALERADIVLFWALIHDISIPQETALPSRQGEYSEARRGDTSIDTNHVYRTIFYDRSDCGGVK